MVAMFPLIRKTNLKMYNKILMRNMKKNLLFILGAAAIMASCSNNEFVDQQQPEVNVPESDVEVAIGAQSVTVTQTRAALDAWDNTPIYVWGLAKNSDNWTNATSKLFSTGHVKGTVSNGGEVTLGEKPDDIYFYPLNSSVNFSFYACSPEPATAPTIQANRVTASYQIQGNNDILWGGAEAADIQNADGNTYSGYNARYFRKGGEKPTLKFDHKLTRLNFKAKKGQENDESSIIPVKIENITITANNNATMTVAGADAGALTAVGGATAELPVFFGDDTYEKRGALDLADNFSESPAGTVMVLPKTGSYTITVSMSAMVGGKKVTPEPSSFEISYTDRKTGVTSFEAGKAYTIRLTVYGLRKVEFETAILTPWDTDTEIIDQEVN